MLAQLKFTSDQSFWFHLKFQLHKRKERKENNQQNNTSQYFSAVTEREVEGYTLDIVAKLLHG